MEENRIKSSSREEEKRSSKLNIEETLPVRTEEPESGKRREDSAGRLPVSEAAQNRGQTAPEKSYETGSGKPAMPAEQSGGRSGGETASAADSVGSTPPAAQADPAVSGNGRLPDAGNDEIENRIPDAGAAEKKNRIPDAGDTEEENRLPDAGAAGEKNRIPDTGSAEKEDHLPDTGSTEKEVENTLAVVRSAPPKKKGRKTATYREKILRHKRRQYRRTVILVLLLMFLLTGGVFLWMYRGYTSAELRRIAALSAEDGAAYANLNGNVVQYGGNGAICIDPRGNTLWTVSYEMQQPIVSVSGNIIAIANRSGYYIYVMNADGLMGTIHTMLPIQNITAAENGEVAVIMSDSRTTWVRLYTAKGREIAYLVRTMAENGYPIAAAISPDGGTLCLSSVQISNAAVKTNVSFYNFGRAGKKVNDHLVDYSDFIDETIPYVRYLDDSTCVGVSDKRLILFRSTLFHSSGSTNILLSENVQGVFSSENFTGLLFTNTSGNSQYRLDLYNRRGKKTGSVSFTMQFNNISIAGDKVYINNEHQCQIFTLGGRCLFDGEFSSSIRALIPGASLNDLLVVTAGEVDSVRLH